jgi:deoxyribodipyrimidine photo-lyase
MPAGGTPAPGARTGLLLTEEDLAPGFVLSALAAPPAGHAALVSVAGRSPQPVAAGVRDFTQAALADAADRWADRMGPRGPVTADPEAIADWAVTAGLDQLVTAHAPVGPAATALARLDRRLKGEGIALVRVLRDYDRAAWPHATHGFFRFKEQIPALVAAL